ncbi:MAG: TatD family hydrolase [Candidatus Babeliales bacterium]
MIDTHCHINMMIKKKFDVPIVSSELPHAKIIIEEAQQAQVNYIINVGTSLIESKNCIELAKTFKNLYASIGIHPNDCTAQWLKDFKELKPLLQKKESNKIIAIGECGFDKHYPGYNLQRQRDAFKAQVELALENDLPIIIHTRDAKDETLDALSEFSKDNIKGVIHCFSEDLAFAKEVINLNFLLGIGGTLTYPKNNILRQVFTTINLEHIILETDAPFLPPQIIRGKENHPKYILTIAEYLAEIRNESLLTIATQTTANARKLFNF